MPIRQESLDTLIYYLHERERIRLAKERGDPRPWTDDKILQTFKFTNVLRANDWTTRKLVDNWYEPNGEATLKELLMAAAIARYFGTWEFCEAVGFSRAASFEKEAIRSLAQTRLNSMPKKKVFTNAYVITNGGISDAKYNVVLDHYLTPFYRALPSMVRIAEETRSFEKLANRMMQIPGFGGTGFMSKEVISDFILATKGRIDWVDLHTWSPVGPGARKGLNYMYGRDPEQSLGNTQGLKELREISVAVAPLLESWMPQIGADLDLHGIQFALCELFKYSRAKFRGERLKNNYTPR